MDEGRKYLVINAIFGVVGFLGILVFILTFIVATSSWLWWR